MVFGIARWVKSSFGGWIAGVKSSRSWDCTLGKGFPRKEGSFISYCGATVCLTATSKEFFGGCSKVNRLMMGLAAAINLGF